MYKISSIGEQKKQSFQKFTILALLKNKKTINSKRCTQLALLKNKKSNKFQKMDTINSIGERKNNNFKSCAQLALLENKNTIIQKVYTIRSIGESSQY